MSPRGTLTPREVDQFASEGFLVRFGSLTPPMVAQLLEVLDVVEECLADPEVAEAVRQSSDSETPTAN